ncbi:MAG: PKD domain-containing protein [Saprospiraceae bacterium]|nr:PKD domain-containing protein [Saprospiraceae bacterium]
MFSETIVIDEDLPISDFDANANEGCAPLTIQFTSQAINADSLWWEFPGGNPGSSSDSNPLVEYDMPGAYNVTLIAFNTAGSASLTRSSWVVIQPAPEAAFESAIDEVTVQFTNNSAHTATYFWTFGDGSTSDEQSPHS